MFPTVGMSIGAPSTKWLSLMRKFSFPVYTENYDIFTANVRKEKPTIFTSVFMLNAAKNVELLKRTSNHKIKLKKKMVRQ